MHLTASYLKKITSQRNLHPELMLTISAVTNPIRLTAVFDTHCYWCCRPVLDTAAAWVRIPQGQRQPGCSSSFFPKKEWVFSQRFTEAQEHGIRGYGIWGHWCVVLRLKTVGSVRDHAT